MSTLEQPKRHRNWLDLERTPLMAHGGGNIPPLISGDPLLERLP